MIKNFDEIKKQLNELSTILNSFKSEAVQLKIIELIFESSLSDEDIDSDDLADKLPKIKVKKKLKHTPKSNTSGDVKVKKSSKMGPGSILNELIGEGFFDTPKTINQITTHSESSKGKKIKSGDFSSKLVRFVRDKKLERTKNADDQYEYTKK